MEILLIAVLIGLLPAAIAKSKGRSFGLWWITDVELELIPAQGDRPNWEIGNYHCKPIYRPTLDRIIDEVQHQHPILEF